MNHTPENHVEAGWKPLPKPKAVCGWCTSTHIADSTCICKEPCSDEKGNPVGWCPAIQDFPPL